MTDANLTFNECVRFIDQYAPSFLKSVKGASADEIETYRDLTGLVVPDEVVEFLRVFGRDDGGFKLFHEPTTNIVDLIRFYREWYQTEIAVPKDCIVIATGGLGVPEVGVQCDGAVSRGIVVIADGKSTYRFGDSLTKVAIQNASLRFRHPLFPYQYHLWGRSQEPQFNAVIAACEGYGFRRLLYSDSMNYCGERASAVVYCTQHEDWVSVRLSCEDEPDMAAIVQGLATAFNLKGKKL